MEKPQENLHSQPQSGRAPVVIHNYGNMQYIEIPSTVQTVNIYFPATSGGEGSRQEEKPEGKGEDPGQEDPGQGEPAQEEPKPPEGPGAEKLKPEPGDAVPGVLPEPGNILTIYVDDPATRQRFAERFMSATDIPAVCRSVLWDFYNDVLADAKDRDAIIISAKFISALVPLLVNVRRGKSVQNIRLSIRRYVLRRTPYTTPREGRRCPVCGWSGG